MGKCAKAREEVIVGKENIEIIIARVTMKGVEIEEEIEVEVGKDTEEKIDRSAKKIKGLMISEGMSNLIKAMTKHTLSKLKKRKEVFWSQIFIKKLKS